MGNAAESRSNVDFQAFRTHFCLVSEQAAANFLPITLIGRIMWSYSFQKR